MTGFKRSAYKTTVNEDATCMWCHEDIDERTGVRSNTWFHGIIGARAVLCSDDCRTKFDADNLVHIIEEQEADDA